MCLNYHYLHSRSSKWLTYISHLHISIPLISLAVICSLSVCALWLINQHITIIMSHDLCVCVTGLDRKRQARANTAAPKAKMLQSGGDFVKSHVGLAAIYLRCVQTTGKNSQDDVIITDPPAGQRSTPTIHLGDHLNLKCWITGSWWI